LLALPAAVFAQPARRFRWIPVSAALCALAATLAGGRAARADEPPGAAIFQQKCARCHGKSGQGTKAYDQPLAGNRSLPQLARYIARSMPEDAPGTCKGPEAEKVAAYVFDAFYSPAARARRKLPRLELARLTVDEYRNALADLITPPRPATAAPQEQGLRGSYFDGSGRRKRTAAFTRTDPVVRFDFGPGTPDHDRFKSGELAVDWQGSVVAPQTGMYDFVVRTEQSTKLWVNDLKRPLIDAAVKSGSETEFRGSLYLLCGRAYPLRLEFFTASLGVRKERKDAPPLKATVALEWKPPRGAAEVIPAHYLRAAEAPASFALAVALPPDDRNAGYERGTSVSKEWVQATTEGAIEAANYVAANLAQLSGVPAEAPDRPARLQAYCAAFAERAFRRPLTPEQKRLYVDRQFEAAADPEVAVKRVVLLVLQSPRFLYREPGGAGDAYDVAARLAFGLWDSLPDAALLRAAASGRLQTRADVAREAERMLNDPRARAKLRGFFLRWLQLDQVAELQKDATKYPGFDGSAVSQLRVSLELFLDEVLWSPASDFRQLLLADHLYLNGRLGRLYGCDLPADAPFQKVTLPGGERAGVLTHPFLLTHLAYTANSSPIHRGVFLARNVLGVTLRPPPDAFAPLAPDLHPTLSTRERVALQTSPKACISCHGVINPLGFTLEHYDAIGRYRDRENGKPVDASGLFVTRSGEVKKFGGVRELAHFLVGSEEAHEAFVARLFHHLVRQPVEAYGPDRLDELRRFFVANDYNMRRLVIESVALAALPDREQQRPAASVRNP
jgi:mono/diheme cytochrome c family protein